MRAEKTKPVSLEGKFYNIINKTKLKQTRRECAFSSLGDKIILSCRFNDSGYYKSEATVIYLRQ